MLKVYVADCRPLEEQVLFDRKIALAGDERRMRILSFRSKADQRRALAATLLLREALTAEGISYEYSHFSTKENGKPCLCGEELYFSLSHAGERAMCAVADHEVGADIESFARFKGKEERTERIAKRCLTERERALLEVSDNFSEGLIRLWTKKESYVKLTGEGLARDFSTIDTLNQAFYEQRDLAGGYCATVCLREKFSQAVWMDNVMVIYE